MIECVPCFRHCRSTKCVSIVVDPVNIYVESISFYPINIKHSLIRYLQFCFKNRTEFVNTNFLILELFLFFFLSTTKSKSAVQVFGTPHIQLTMGISRWPSCANISNNTYTTTMMVIVINVMFVSYGVL